MDPKGHASVTRPVHTRAMAFVVAAAEPELAGEAGRLRHRFHVGHIRGVRV